MGIFIFSGIVFAIVFLFVFCVFVLTRHLLQIALDRVPPRSLGNNQDILKSITKNDEFMTALHDGELRLEEEETETVFINGYRNTKLVGHYLATEPADRIIIAVHGWRSSWSRDFGTISEFFKQTHSSVLFVEQRAQRQSGGDYITFGVFERYDILEWIRFVESINKNNLPIYLCGVSMGATTVLLSSELGLPRSVKGIIADCGYTSPSAIWESIVHTHLHLPYVLMRGLADRIFAYKVGYSAACSTVNALRKCKTPVLFVHGDSDDFVPVAMTYENYRACASEKYILTVKNANHGMSYFLNKAAYEHAVLDFWHKTAA